MTEHHSLMRHMREVLADLYDDQASAERVADDIGLDTTRIERADRQIDFWHNILKETECQGKIELLLALALEEYPARTDLIALRNEYRALGLTEATEAKPPPTTQRPEPLESAAQRILGAPPRSRWLWLAVGLVAVVALAVFIRGYIDGMPTMAPEATQPADRAGPQAANSTATEPAAVLTVADVTPSATFTAVPTPTGSPAPVPSAAPSPNPTWIAVTTATGPNEMVLVYVSGGSFTMGSTDADPEAMNSEKPQHTIYVEGFWIGQTEVTNAQYARCVLANACSAPHNATYQLPENSGKPVTDVTWYQANAYAHWVAGRLPSEAEWEKACRGAADARIYPWGNMAPTDELLNYDNDLAGQAANVGSYPAGASPYGALDMAGNVWEWTSSLWGDEPKQPTYTYPYDPQDGRANLDAPSSFLRVLRGGQFGDRARSVRCAERYWYLPTASWPRIGFRVIASPVNP